MLSASLNKTFPSFILSVYYLFFSHACYTACECNICMYENIYNSVGIIILVIIIVVVVIIVIT